jgi:hypothetical protein
MGVDVVCIQRVQCTCTCATGHPTARHQLIRSLQPAQPPILNQMRLDGEPLEEGDVFYALHGETPDSFRLGQLVEARVRYVDTSVGRFAKLDILPNEIEGILDWCGARLGGSG